MSVNARKGLSVPQMGGRAERVKVKREGGRGGA